MEEQPDPSNPPSIALPSCLTNLSAWINEVMNVEATWKPDETLRCGLQPVSVLSGMLLKNQPPGLNSQLHSPTKVLKKVTTGW